MGMTTTAMEMAAIRTAHLHRTGDGLTLAAVDAPGTTAHLAGMPQPDRTTLATVSEVGVVGRSLTPGHGLALHHRLGKCHQGLRADPTCV